MYVAIARTIVIQKLNKPSRQVRIAIKTYQTATKHVYKYKSLQNKFLENYKLSKNLQLKAKHLSHL